MYAEALERQAQAIQWVQRHSRRADLPVFEAAVTTGETYYWHPELLPVLTAGGQSLPTSTRLAEDMLPSPAGFCWFGAPLRLDVESALRLMPDVTPEQRALWADVGDWEVLGMVWSTQTVPRDQVLGGQHEGLVASVCLFVRDPLRLPKEGNSLWNGAGLYPFFWFFQDDLAANLDFTHGVSEQGYDRSGVQWALNVFAAALLFLHQGLALADRPIGVDRHARKRAERAGWTSEPLVRVIRLRRIQAAAHDHDAPSQVDWACRWVVRGHWRQQWFPSVQQNRPMWIAPYVKGPDDKPMKAPRATVFAVVR